MKNFIKATALFFAVFFLQSGIVKAASLMVSPTRIEFNGRDRSKEIKLINKSDKKVTYRISFQHLRMSENGSYEEIAPGQENGEKYVDDMIRYSPRQITLEPGGVQTVRLMLRKPDNLQDGEYRSHMLFREEAPADFGTSVEAPKAGSNKISITLKPLFGVSIPVIVKNGNVNSTAQISDMNVKRRQQVAQKPASNSLLFKINRTGNASIFGDFVVSFVPDNSSKEYEIANLNAVSVFTPYQSRNIEIALNYPKGFAIDSPGQIKLTYYGRNDDVTDKSKILAQKTIRNN